ncbi:trypsin-like serine protease [Hufsiella ginkgonis]|uniref:Trypsin-like serine protease n=1 Tax=Hufsiella ginkgonis TaxID=2695274 RepID=A0A7K1XSS7_9SPHI|nr:trypsin-like serine protease [Hufsiella ginkgonis]MXV14063.1 trypsin-like serine protease [Hufsiella ginkgonis]
MKNKLVLFFGSILTGIVSFAGIMRDDAEEAGYRKLAAEHQFDCVGKLFNGDRMIGSCVLIGKRKVLSAAHVMMEYTSFRQDTMKMGNSTVVLNVPTSSSPVEAAKCHARFGDRDYAVKLIRIHPDYGKNPSSADLAFIGLAAEVTKVKPARLNTTPDELGAAVVGVGYGASGFSSKPAEVTQSRKKLAGQNMVDSLGGRLLNGNRTTLICDFDSPLEPSWNRIGSAKPLPLEYICSGGDSGGGLFRKGRKGWELVGLCHNSESGISTLLTQGYYGLLMEWTRISVYHHWIDQ